MNLDRAKQLVTKACPKRKIEGYWKVKNEFVFKLTNQNDDILLEAPLFVVTPAGTVYPTNPAIHDVELETMSKV